MEHFLILSSSFIDLGLRLKSPSQFELMVSVSLFMIVLNWFWL